MRRAPAVNVPESTEICSWCICSWCTFTSSSTLTSETLSSMGCGTVSNDQTYQKAGSSLNFYALNSYS